tara:strand:- start:2413 stop:2847 length:435 start_codon:yes stop_codon:yes gene_type:complete
MTVKAILTTHSIKGQHTEPQPNTPMSEIKVIKNTNTPVDWSFLPTTLILDIIKQSTELKRVPYNSVMDELLGLNALEMIEEGCACNEAFGEIIEQDTTVDGVYCLNGDYFIDTEADFGKVWSKEQLDAGRTWLSRLGKPEECSV